MGGLEGLIGPNPPHIPSPGRHDRQAEGLQQSGEWSAGQNQPIQLLDATRAAMLWRVSVVGDVAIRLLYGTRATIELNAWAPFVAGIPGQVALWATPLDDTTPTRALATLTPSAAPGVTYARTTLVSPGPFPAAAGRFTALSASTLTIAGIVGVAVAIGASIPVVAGSLLTAGSGIVDLAV